LQNNLLFYVLPFDVFTRDRKRYDYTDLTKKKKKKMKTLPILNNCSRSDELKSCMIEAVIKN